MLDLRLARDGKFAFNIVVTNRITGLFAGWLPGFGVLTHVGRKSGKVYRTPINVFRIPNGFIIALTYSSQSEWVKNVLAAGGCELKTVARAIACPHRRSCTIRRGSGSRFRCDLCWCWSVRTSIWSLQSEKLSDSVLNAFLFELLQAPNQEHRLFVASVNAAHHSLRGLKLRLLLHPHLLRQSSRHCRHQ